MATGRMPPSTRLESCRSQWCPGDRTRRWRRASAGLWSWRMTPTRRSTPPSTVTRRSDLMRSGASFVYWSSNTLYIQTNTALLHTNNTCHLFCDRMLVSTIQCRDGFWSGRPNLGFWCNSRMPGVKGEHFERKGFYGLSFTGMLCFLALSCCIFYENNTLMIFSVIIVCISYKNFYKIEF